MDRQDVVFRRWAASHGVGLKLEGSWTTAEWQQLLDAKNQLNKAITATMDAADGKPVGEDADALDVALDVVGAIKSEMDTRDQAGNRGPRSKYASGRVTDPLDPGTGLPAGSEAVDRGTALAKLGVYGTQPTYNALFGPPPRDTRGFKSFGEFFASLASGRLDPRLVRAAAGSVGVGADGGYAVAPMFAHDLLDLSLEGEIVRPRAHVYPMDSAILVVPGFDALNHTGASIAGFTGGWVKELSTSTAQKPKMRDITLRLEKCGIYGQVSNELLRFATYMDAELMRLLAQAIGFYLDTGFLTGTGAAGQPLGVLNDPALITVSKEGSQSADTIVASNLLKMFARLHPQCFRNAIWVVNQSTLPQLLSVNIEYTRGTDGLAIRPEPLFREVASGSFVCMGRPVIVTEKTPGLGDKGDIILADFGQYAVGMYRDIFIDKSNAPGWYTDATDYRALVHAGGMGKWNAPLTPANGSTLSWCVTLEAR